MQMIYLKIVTSEFFSNFAWGIFAKKVKNSFELFRILIVLIVKTRKNSFYI